METEGERRNGVWLFFAVGGGIAAAAGVYLVLRALRKGPSSANVRKVEAIIKEAEDLIKYHK